MDDHDMDDNNENQYQNAKKINKNKPAFLHITPYLPNHHTYILKKNMNDVLNSLQTKKKKHIGQQQPSQYIHFQVS